MDIYIPSFYINLFEMFDAISCMCLIISIISIILILNWVVDYDYLNDKEKTALKITFVVLILSILIGLFLPTTYKAYIYYINDYYPTATLDQIKEYMIKVQSSVIRYPTFKE